MLAQTMEALLRRFELRRSRRAIVNSLALNRRGEVRSDGLTLIGARQRLEIRWRARGIHPWDEVLPYPEKVLAFVEQSLLDTEAALFRLFEAMPAVDVVDFIVLEPTSDRIIVEGVVSRSDLIDSARFRHLSIRMRLNHLGINEYTSSNTSFPMSVETQSETAPREP